MKMSKALPLLALGLIACLICAGCGSSSKPVPKQQLRIMISNLPTGTMGTAYSAPAQASGGTAPYMWSIASGTLPSGLSLSAATGMITGMPTAVGTSTFALQVTDSASTPGSATASLSITIQAAVLAVNTTSLPAGTAGVAYSTTLTATGGVTPYSWSVLTGNLPLGLSLSTAGVISGAPTTTGTSTFTVRVGDAESAPLTATAQLSITVNTVNIATQSLPAGTVNVSYSTTLAAVGGVTP